MVGSSKGRDQVVIIGSSHNNIREQSWIYSIEDICNTQRYTPLNKRGSSLHINLLENLDCVQKMAEWTYHYSYFVHIQMTLNNNNHTLANKSRDSYATHLLRTFSKMENAFVIMLTTGMLTLNKFERLQILQGQNQTHVG